MKLELTREETYRKVLALVEGVMAKGVRGEIACGSTSAVWDGKRSWTRWDYRQSRYLRVSKVDLINNIIRGY